MIGNKKTGKKISNVNVVIEDKGKRKWNNMSVHNILKLLFSETESGNYFSLTQFSLSEIKAGNNCQTKTSQRSSVNYFHQRKILFQQPSPLVSKCLVWGWRFRFLSGRKNNLGPGSTLNLFSLTTLDYSLSASVINADVKSNYLTVSTSEMSWVCGWIPTCMRLEFAGSTMQYMY